MIQRHIFAAVSALFITYGLIFLMAMLIKTGKDPLTLDKIGRIVDFVRIKEDESIKVKSRKAKRPERQQPPPQLPKQRLDNIANTNDALNMSFTYQPEVNLAAPDLSADGEYLPFYKVNPIYPQRALERNIEGYVTLQFTVTKLGTVQDPVVIDASPPNIFNRAAIKAVLKYRYKPRVVDGRPVDAPGVKTQIIFQLEGGDDK